MNWQHLQSIDDVQKAIELSNERMVVLFKHSTRCPVSSMARNVLESQWHFEQSIAPFHLDLIAFRDVSNFIADHFSVKHESPQMIAIRNQKVLHHASHMDIGVEEIEALL